MALLNAHQMISGSGEPEPGVADNERAVAPSWSRDVGVALISSIPGLLIFFRAAFTSGFDKIMGNIGDARLQVYSHEHWLRVLRGDVSWTSPEFFYPTKGVLGYSDTFFLNEVFYLPLRAAGLDEFLAVQWTMVLMSITGFVAAFLLFRRVLSLSYGRSAALATVLIYPNALYVQSSHLQLFSLFWVPVLVLGIWKAFESANTRASRLWAAGSGAFLGMLFFSTYYIAWFTCLAGLIYAITIALLRGPGRWRAGGRELIARYWLRASCFLVGFGVAMIPFAITYLPVLRSAGGRRYEDAMLFAAGPLDVVNVSGENYVWGAAMRSTLNAARLNYGEISLALTPVLLLCVLGAAVLGFVARRRQWGGHLAESALALGVTVAVLVMLPVQFSFGSLWRLPWTMIPGAVGIRAINRVSLIAGPCAVFAIGCALQLLERKAESRGRRGTRRATAVAIVLGLIIVEQLNVGDISQIDRSEEIKALVLTDAPPIGCESFYVTDSSGSASFFQASIDAMLISQHFDIPTLNGYSGQVPKGFTFLDQAAPTYLDQARAWAALHHLDEHLCSFDRATHRWQS